jgi:hypothetical protein
MKIWNLKDEKQLYSERQIRFNNNPHFRGFRDDFDFLFSKMIQNTFGLKAKIRNHEGLIGCVLSHLSADKLYSLFIISGIPRSKGQDKLDS